MSVKFTDNSKALLAQFERNKAKALEMIGLHGQRRATEEITAMRAVDTGRLRASISYQPDVANSQVHIGTNVEYGPYVHDGTSRMAARPFIGNAVLNYGKEYQEIAERTLGEGFEK